MKLVSRIKYTTTYGKLALALFSLVLLSGILLAIPYDVSRPYLSVGKIILLNPYASFIRNVHFWSAQLFLVLTLLHLYDHFRKRDVIHFKAAIWFRLTIGVLILFLAMLTGFLLKGDADSRQARLILENLLTEIPFLGNLLAYSLLGKEGSYLLIYVHHIATFTVFLTVIILEHSRKIVPKARDFLLAAVVTILLSYFFTAPLHNTLGGAVKGPWYFVGLQEILHLLSHPAWVLLLGLLLLLLLYLIPFVTIRRSFVIRRMLLFVFGVYLVLTFIGMFFRGEDWRWTTPWQPDYHYQVLGTLNPVPLDFSPDFDRQTALASPKIRGQYESCLFCHTDVKGFTQAHRPQVVGCYSCHGGNPFSTDKKQAHKGMKLIPGNLADASQSCGTAQCHPDITRRVQTGLMATLSGMISVDRFVFDEQTSPDSLTDIHHLKNSAADEHLKNLCVRCHLGNPKTALGPITERSRGGGCLACHLNDNAGAYTAWKGQDSKQAASYLKVHPAISLQVSDNHCFGCHSRSGRIATNYEGWHETPLSISRMPDTVHYRLVEGSRVFVKEKEDIHHRKGMECIDCHTSFELMGDGNRYHHEEEQEDVQCTDCHLRKKPRIIAAKHLDEESAILAALRYGSIAGLQFLQTEKQKHPLINTRYNNGTVRLIGKNSHKTMVIPRIPERCGRDKVHQAVSCSACHSSWAPSCIGCHNRYDPEEPAYDMVENKEKKGGWVEYTGVYLAHLPTLGIRNSNGKKEVIPVVPGMILTIDKGSFSKKVHDSLLFKRLFAPIAPHTTAAKGRSCVSCHNNPVALGFGKGTLQYTTKAGKGQWQFIPSYANNPHDGLPEDAWIGFLKERHGMVSTRANVTPFSVKEQEKMLTVGACLTCHDGYSKPMQQGLQNFEDVLKRVSKKCVLPVWRK